MTVCKQLKELKSTLLKKTPFLIYAERARALVSNFFDVKLLT